MARFALIIAALLFAPAARGEALPGPYPAEVLRVLDGDSFEARVRIWLDQDVTVIVRIAGIDTAEMDAPCASARVLAAAARSFLTARALGGLTLSGVTRDKFGGRVVATVNDAAGADLGAALIAAGLAQPYRGRRPGWCGVGLFRGEEGRGREKSENNSAPDSRALIHAPSAGRPAWLRYAWGWPLGGRE